MGLGDTGPIYPSHPSLPPHLASSNTNPHSLAHSFPQPPYSHPSNLSLSVSSMIFLISLLLLSTFYVATVPRFPVDSPDRSEEHTSELQSR